MTSGGGSPVNRRTISLVVLAVTVAWFMSVLAYFANPGRYPISLELFGLMGVVLSGTLGAAVWNPRKPPERPELKDDPDA